MGKDFLPLATEPSAAATAPPGFTAVARLDRGAGAEAGWALDDFFFGLMPDRLPNPRAREKNRRRQGPAAQSSG